MKKPISTEEASKKLVKRLLSQAFPDLKQRKDLSRCSHEECVEMRSRLLALRDEDLPYALYEVLDDLLETHTGRLGDSEDAEAVVQYLNVMVEGTDLQNIKEVYGEEGLAQTFNDEAFLREASVKAFSTFTVEQAAAICSWLEHTRDWPELKWYLNEIDVALAYWKTRAKPIATKQ